MSTIEKVKEEILLDELVDVNNEIVLYNDDVNTFNHVIETLIRVCNHTAEQAEQCSYIIHLRGKYAVKNGTYEDLKPLCDAITERGINATVEVVAG